MKFPTGLSGKLTSRQADGTLRSLQLKNSGIDFCSNDYLGFSRSRILSVAFDKSEEQKTLPMGSTGSRLISGNTKVHQELETDLANYFGAPEALLFNSGYDANIGLLSAILERGDRIFFDQLSHASIRDGIRLSDSRAFGFKHNDLGDLKKKVKNVTARDGQTYVVVESIYSMDGDQAPLQALVELCEKEGILLIVDEAHATGVIGPKGKGLVAEFGLENKVFARVHTFGKALGGHGAAVLGSQELKQYLVNYARSFIYTTALPPAEAVKVSLALRLMETTDQITNLQQNIHFFLKEANELGLAHCFLPSQSPIQSFLLKFVNDADRLEQKMEQEGFAVKSIKAPTVPKGEERIRVCLHSFNTSQQIRRILYLLSTFV